jgi:hypothetical protein
MGMLMIRCPITGRPFFTGRYVETATFRASPVFFSRTYCPHCRATHEWFARDAWVCNAGRSEYEGACERQVA